MSIVQAEFHGELNPNNMLTCMAVSIREAHNHIHIHNHNQ